MVPVREVNCGRADGFVFFFFAYYRTKYSIIYGDVARAYTLNFIGIIVNTFPRDSNEKANDNNNMVYSSGFYYNITRNDNNRITSTYGVCCVRMATGCK